MASLTGRILKSSLKDRRWKHDDNILFYVRGKPKADNLKKEDFAGAYVSCWVGSTDLNTALMKTSSYINDKGWDVINVEDQFVTSRDRYENDDEFTESLECFDKAENDGIAAIFHTWTYDG